MTPIGASTQSCSTQTRRASSTPPRPSSTFFFNYTATTEIYTLSLHDALPISRALTVRGSFAARIAATTFGSGETGNGKRSEEHTSELQSHHDLVCRLLLEKKKIISRFNAIDKHQ